MDCFAGSVQAGTLDTPFVCTCFNDYLGNVMTTISDRKLPFANNSNNIVDGFVADITSSQDYYPFGSLQPGRYWNSDDYRFGFNGKEMENELYESTGSAYDFGARMYDSRLGRWLSVDPLQHSYPSLSTYQFCANNPISNVDPDGQRIKWSVSRETKQKIKAVLKVYRKNDVFKDLMRTLRRDKAVIEIMDRDDYVSKYGGIPAGASAAHWALPIYVPGEYEVKTGKEDTEDGMEELVLYQVCTKEPSWIMINKRSVAITFSDFSSAAVLEEFIHAWQYLEEYPTLKDVNNVEKVEYNMNGRINIEMDAKMVKAYIILLSGHEVDENEYDDVFAEVVVKDFIDGNNPFEDGVFDVFFEGFREGGYKGPSNDKDMMLFKKVIGQ